MATTIQLQNSSSNFVSFLTNWTSGFTSTYGTFWSEEEGLVNSQTEIAQNPQYEYSQWGNGSSGSKGVVLDGDFQYSQGNLTGTTESLTFGTNYQTSEANGLSIGSADLVVLTDQSFNHNGVSPDVFDLAIYNLTVNGSLSGLFNYFAATGTVIEDTTASDTLTGFAGSDTFVFSGGNDVVTTGPTGTYGFQDTIDFLDVTGWGATSVSDLFWYNNASGNVVVGTSLNFGVSVTLVGVSASDISAADFVW